MPWLFPSPKTLACRSRAVPVCPCANQIRVGANVMYSCLAAIAGITTVFAMLYVARLDAFAGVRRVECLKEVVLKVGGAFDSLEHTVCDDRAIC